MSAPLTPSLPIRRCSCRYPVQIGNGLLLDSAAGTAQYLSRTPPSTAGNRSTWTWSGWVRRGSLAGIAGLFGARQAGATSATYLAIVSHCLVYYDVLAGVVQAHATSAPLLRDVGGYYHIVCAVDYTHADPLERVRLYVNGERQALTLVATPTPSHQSRVNSVQPHSLGRSVDGAGTASYLDGFLAAVDFVDGAALGPEAFGAPRGDHWVPLVYTGERGFNGTRLEFGAPGDLGADTSGAGNHWTVNGAPVQTLDSPTNTYPTRQQACGSDYYSGTEYGVTTLGGLRTRASAYTFAWWPTIHLPARGRWYFEVRQSVAGDIGLRLGVVVPTQRDLNHGAYTLGDTVAGGGVLYRVDNSTVVRWAGASYETLATGLGTNVANNVHGVAVDLDAREMRCTCNGVQVSGPHALPAVGDRWSFVLAAHLAGSNILMDFGQLGWWYGPPAGYQPLCTANLPCGLATVSGTYTGTGLANGPYVPTGCELDSLTINGTALYNDGSARGVVDFLAAGFKLRSSAHNANGTTYTWTGVVRTEQRCANAVVN
ncbi:LamG-like jellyroll fold domain-containing protein [Desulfocurvus vexinensis]|uniref:LamG-like jellyroll fold domain-containing protein n=1 Tax=Desulfocurvus vexinensis TaxID=399548 RepID=UPI0004B6025F|nr:LamG-like jellyroll fold domain-containing protein [Desulfocurvus vexinensis]